MRRGIAILAISFTISLPSLSALPQESATNAVEAATALIKAARYEAAHELLISGAAQRGNDPRPWTLDGYALTRMGRNPEALASYESALKLAPEYLPALEGAAELKFKMRTSDAADLLTRIANLSPKEQTAHAMLATLAFERGDCQTALTEFRMSEQLVATQPAALEQRGACLLRLHQTSEAVIVFLQVQKLNPGSARSHYNLALSQFQAGLYRDAVATLNSVPSSAFDPDMLDLLADACERLADTPTAAEALQKAIMLQPDNPRPYVRFADLCLAHNSFQAGIDMLNSGINRAPNAASLYLARGILRVQLAQISAAEEDFTRAEMMDPNSHYAGVLQQMTKLQENKLDSAADDLRKRIKKQPNNAYLQYLLAETLIRSGAPIDGPEFSQAISAAKTAVQLQPSLGLARDVLGRLYLQQGNLEDAVEQSRRAYANDPTDQTALYHLIRALKSAGRTSEVAELTKQLAKLRQESERTESDQRRYSIVVGAAGK